MQPEKAILTLAEKQCVGMKHRLWKICNSNGDILKKAGLCRYLAMKKYSLANYVFAVYIYKQTIAT